MSRELKAMEMLKNREWATIEHYNALCECVESGLKRLEISEERLITEKEEMIKNIKALKKYHHDLWDWYWSKNNRDKRLEHFFKLQVLEELLILFGENKQIGDNEEDEDNGQDK